MNCRRCMPTLHRRCGPKPAQPAETLFLTTDPALVPGLPQAAPAPALPTTDASVIPSEPSVGTSSSEKAARDGARRKAHAVRTSTVISLSFRQTLPRCRSSH